jgi:hypothetical protein
MNISKQIISKMGHHDLVDSETSQGQILGPSAKNLKHAMLNNTI